jgi:hypothetical protein
MSLRQVVDEFEERRAKALEARGAVDKARHEHLLAASRLAYATRTRKPESAVQQLREAEYTARVALQRARRALLRAM